MTLHSKVNLIQNTQIAGGVITQKHNIYARRRNIVWVILKKIECHHSWPTHILALNFRSMAQSQT